MNDTNDTTTPSFPWLTTLPDKRKAWMLDSTPETVRELYLLYSQMPNIPCEVGLKFMGLIALGVSREEAQRMCEPKERTEEERLADLEALHKERLKELGIYDK